MANSLNRLPLIIILIAAIVTLGVVAFLFTNPNKADDPSGAADATEKTTSAVEVPVETTNTPKTDKPADPERSAAASSVIPAGPQPVRLPESYIKALSGLSGRIVEPGGTPVKGAKVELLGGMIEFITADIQTLVFDPDQFDPKVEQQRVTTAADGKFTFERVDPRLFYVIGVNLGLGRPNIRFVDRTPNPTESLDLGDITLDPPLAVSGKVITKTGNKPIAGARVSATTIPFAAYSAGIANVNKDTTLLIEIGRGMDQPMIWNIPTWARNLFDKLPFPATTTGADGSFTIEGVPSGEITLLVETKNFPPAIQRVTPTKNAQKDAGEIVVDEGKEAFGMVVNDDGKPVAGAELMVGIPSPLAKDNVSFLVKKTKSDAEGKFSVSGLGANEVVLAGRAAGMANWVVSKPQALTGDDITFKLPVTQSATILVFDEEGKPASIQKMAVTPGDDGPNEVPQIFPPNVIKPILVEPGKYRIDGLQKGKHIVIALADGYALATTNLEITGESGAEAKIQLDRGRHIKIKVLGKENGKPVPLEAANIVCNRPKEGARDGFLGFTSGRTDASGMTTVRGAREGASLVYASHPGYAIQFARIEDLTINELTFQMQIGGTVTGLLSKSGKVPDKPYLLSLSRDGWDRDAPDFPRLVLTDLDGKFKFTHIPPGKYEVTVMPMRLGDKNIATIGSSFEELFNIGFFEEPKNVKVEVIDEQIADVRLDLEKDNREATDKDARLHGVITKNGLPFANAPVMVYGSEYRRFKTDDNGRYDTGPIRVGDWTQISVSDPSNRGNDQLSSRSIKLKPGEEKELNIDIKLAGPLRGIVRSAITGEPIAHAQISANKQYDVPENHNPEDPDFDGWGWSNINRQTDANGEFEILEIPEGKYIVEARAQDHGKARTSTLHVATGVSVARIELTLPRGIEVSGKVVFEDSKNAQWAGLYFQRITKDGSESEWAQIQNDKFSIKSLSPGKYRVELQAWSRGTDSANVDTAMLQFDSIEIEVPAGGLTNQTYSFVKKKLAPQKIEGPTPEEPQEIIIK
ncbi:MAG: carboxypeptidase regulatory-like domain-containing protein [Planctomycetota bacterium]